MEEISCSVCKTKKLPNEFSRISKSRLTGTCKKCQCEASKKCRLQILEKKLKNESLTENTITEKQCSKCKETKSVNDFPKDSGKKDGYSSSCKICNCKKSKEFRLKIITGEIQQNTPQSEQKCMKCNEIKKIQDFGKDKGTKTGFRSTCKLCNCNQAKEYASKTENIEKIKQRKKEYRGRPEIQERERERYKNDILFRLKSLTRGRLRRELRKQDIDSKNDSTLMYTGCSVDFLYKWLQFQFDDNMNWENMGSYWHIDHIIPCSVFDVSKEDDIIKCFHWSNLQPLECIENMSKNNKIEQKYIEKLVNNLIKFNEINTEFIGYQTLIEMLEWLGVEPRYGNNPIDVDEYIKILSQSAIRSQVPTSVNDKDMEKVQRLNGSGFIKSNQL